MGQKRVVARLPDEMSVGAVSGDGRKLMNPAGAVSDYVKGTLAQP
jgi:hypothetical protein